jgi:hypothetical protein
MSFVVETTTPKGFPVKRKFIFKRDYQDVFFLTLYL